MAGLNKCQIIGRLGQNPEVKYSQAGTAVCNMSVATSETWADKNTGEKQERTEWHKIVVFGKTAENCGKYLAKGRQCYVEGKLQTSSYEKDGQNHYTTKIIADVVMFLDSKDSGNGQPQQQQGGYTPQPQKQTPAQQQMQTQQHDTGGDDIPF